ncbi:hypothetical protein [Ornithinimicrobium pekingense]|nr:hypothetical protein [Ornithinimicrobium pekingense]
MRAEAGPVLVLLEGPSDVAALGAVLGRCAPRVPRTAYRLVDMGGVTNTAAHLRAARADRPSWPVLGLCDEAESWVVARALQQQGVEAGDGADLAQHGFFVCRRDLEEELIRALGVEGCLLLLERAGLGHRFRSFSRQRVWADRPVRERLHRFAGVASGRKILLARQMAAALPAESVPPPLAALARSLQELAGERTRS